MINLTDNQWYTIPANDTTVYKGGQCYSLTVLTPDADCIVKMANNGGVAVVVRTVLAGTGEVAMFVPPCDLIFTCAGQVQLNVQRVIGGYW